jgi:hypothetical protein
LRGFGRTCQRDSSLRALKIKENAVTAAIPALY